MKYNLTVFNAGKPGLSTEVSFDNPIKADNWCKNVSTRKHNRIVIEKDGVYNEYENGKLRGHSYPTGIVGVEQFYE